jgi:hypothetical protein
LAAIASLFDNVESRSSGKRKRQLVFLNFERRKELSVVITAVENRLPVIPTSDHMENRK